jgi:hypothetical protein
MEEQELSDLIGRFIANPIAAFTVLTISGISPASQQKS